MADRLGWAPPASVLNGHGTVMYIDGSRSDWVGVGVKQLYTRHDTMFSGNGDVSMLNGTSELSVSATNNSWWNLNATEPNHRLTTGYWSGVGDGTDTGVDNRSGGLSFDGNGRGCGGLNNQFEITDLTYATNGQLLSLEMRFHFRCGNQTGPIGVYGYYRYDANDYTVPPQPTAATDLAWHAPVGALPTTGNYFYTDSTDSAVTPETTGLITGAKVTADAYSNSTGPGLTITADEPVPNQLDREWSLMLSAPYNPDRLIVGTYSNAGQYSNPGGNSDLVLLGTTGCESVGDQFAIDQVAYNAAGNLQSVTLRGQFHCGDGIVHIAARWTAP